MSLRSSLGGTVTVRINGANLPATLDALAQRGIPICRCIFLTELEVQVTIPRSGYRQLKQICEKRGDTLDVLRRGGMYWAMKSLRNRPVLIAGAMLYLFASLYLPSRVLFVRTEGNSRVPAKQILEAAEASGIRFGASRRAVRSEKMKNALLEAVPQLQWAGVNTYGCVAKISVREKNQEKEATWDSSLGHIVAGMDGVVQEVTALRGTLLCAPGQAVSAGDILISGYTDSGLAIRAEQAEGEVYAATRRSLRVLMPDSGQIWVSDGAHKKKISILLGKKRINLWKDSGIWDTTCDRMYEEYYITLPGGFQLPFGWSVEKYRVRELSCQKWDRQDMEDVLSGTAEAYLKSQMISGIIRDRVRTFYESSGSLQLAGEYSCVEMIGFRQRLEIGDTNGENN